MNALVRDPLDWIDVGAVSDVPVRGARRVPTPAGDVAIFRTGDGRVFARAAGRSRAFLRAFGVSRIVFREMALDGKIPGVRKSSW